VYTAGHGTGHQMLKAGSKRRRTRAELDEAKMLEEVKQEETEERAAEI